MDEICRICLDNVQQGLSINISYKVTENKTVSELLNECATVEIKEEDLLPKNICLKCYQKLIILSEFRQLIISSDKHLKGRLTYVSFSQNMHVTSSHIKVLSNDLRTNEEVFENNFLFNEIEGVIKNETLHQLTSNDRNDTSDNEKNSQVSREQTEINKIGVNLQAICTKLKPGRKPTCKSKDKRKVHEFKCDICQKVLFGRSNRLEQHIIMAHSDIRNYICNNCDKKFKSKQQLTNHMRVHTGEKPYICEICQRSFASPQNLFNHKKNHTGSNKNYKCDTCHKGYATPGELVTHKRIVHTGEKPFLCEICSRAYSSIRNLGLHIRSVHEKNEKCPTCGIMLSVKRIKQHMQRHSIRQEGIRRFTCEKCGKGFFSSHSLKKHQVVHTGERPFSCKECHKCFSQKSAVDIHMRTHSDVRSFCCEFCTKTFKYKQHLSLHINKNHKKD